MSLTVNDSGGGGDFKQVAPGTYAARCIKVIDLGTQDGEWEGKPLKRKQVLVTWELPTELITEGELAGKPYAVSKFYTASLGDKANLRKDLVGWRGKDFTVEELEGFSLRNILGKACMVSVIHSTKGKAKVGGVMSVPKGMVVPEAINPTVWFDITDWNNDAFFALSEGIQKLIRASYEYKEMHSDMPAEDVAKAVGGEVVDDSAIPF
jgi:hypothetical protein